MNIDEIIEAVRTSYGLGPVLDVRELNGSGASYLIISRAGSYVFKRVGRADFVAVYDKVQAVLNQNGLIQAKVFPAKDGSLMLPDGFSLLEYIPGDAVERFDDDQFRRVVRFLPRYNRLLRQVPFEPGEILNLNVWDEVKSTEFICSQVEPLIEQRIFDVSARVVLRKAAKILADSLDLLSDVPKQLIHSDLGPGNIIFTGGEVKSVIDFTPAYDHELYSLAQFLYWTCLWDFEKDRSYRRIGSALDEGKDALFALLVKACMFRFLGSALNMHRSGTFESGRLARRLSALDHLFAISGSLGIA